MTRINHKADWAKCLGPTRKKGPKKVKYGKWGPTKTEKGHTKHIMKVISLKKFSTPHRPYEILIQPFKYMFLIN